VPANNLNIYDDIDICPGVEWLSWRWWRRQRWQDDDDDDYDYDYYYYYHHHHHTGRRSIS